MANERTIQVVINSEEQEQLWDEIEIMVAQNSWGGEPWDFTNAAKREFILLRKSDFEESG